MRMPTQTVPPRGTQPKDILLSFQRRGETQKKRSRRRKTGFRALSPRCALRTISTRATADVLKLTGERAGAQTPQPRGGDDVGLSACRTTGEGTSGQESEQEIKKTHHIQHNQGPSPEQGAGGAAGLEQSEETKLQNTACTAVPAAGRAGVTTPRPDACPRAMVGTLPAHNQVGRSPNSSAVPSDQGALHLPRDRMGQAWPAGDGHVQHLFLGPRGKVRKPQLSSDVTWQLESSVWNLD